MSKCSECRFWRYGDGDDNDYGVAFAPCKRYPPQAVPKEYPVGGSDEERKALSERGCFFDFPWVSEHEWCGEFAPSNAKVTGAARLYAQLHSTDGLGIGDNKSGY